MTDERWRPIPGYEGRYEASDQGRIRSLPRTVVGSNGGRYPVRGGVLRLQTRDNGYLTVLLGRGGSPQLVHRLVMAAFVGPCPEGQEVRHLNGDRSDDRLGNLAYGTKSRNMYDAVQHGTHRQTRKTHCPRNHPYDEENTYLDGGSRRCKTCNRERARANHRAKRAA